MLLPSGGPGKAGPHGATRPWKAWLLLMHTYWAPTEPRSMGSLEPMDTNAGRPHNGEGPRAFYGPGPDPWPSKRAQRGPASRRGRRIQRVPSFAGDSMHT